MGVCMKICALRDSRWQFLVRYNDDVSVYTSLKCMSVAVAAWTVAVQFFLSFSHNIGWLHAPYPPPLFSEH